MLRTTIWDYLLLLKLPNRAEVIVGITVCSEQSFIWLIVNDYCYRMTLLGRSSKSI